jgi:hypothetical protein
MVVSASLVYQRDTVASEIPTHQRVRRSSDLTAPSLTYFAPNYSDIWLSPLLSRRTPCYWIQATIGRDLRFHVDGKPELGGQVVFVPSEERGDDVLWEALRLGNGIELVVKDL